MGDAYDHLLKLVLVGDSAVGKTSLLLTFVQGEFNEDSGSTVGVDLKVKMHNHRGKCLKLTIWDTAGQERFRTLTSAYYRGGHGIVFVYDTTNRASFDNLKSWLAEADVYTTRQAIKMLVGNKIDKTAERVVSKAEGMAFARTHSMLFIEASAKTSEGVQQAFDELCQKVLDDDKLQPVDNSVKRLQENGDYEAGYCC